MLGAFRLGVVKLTTTANIKRGAELQVVIVVVERNLGVSVLVPKNSHQVLYFSTVPKYLGTQIPKASPGRASGLDLLGELLTW